MTSGSESKADSPWSMSVTQWAHLPYVAGYGVWTTDFLLTYRLTLFYGKYHLLLYYYFFNISVLKRPHRFFLVKNQKFPNFYC